MLQSAFLSILFCLSLRSVSALSPYHASCYLFPHLSFALLFDERRCRRDEAMAEGAWELLPDTLESVFKNNDTGSTAMVRRNSARSMKRGASKSSILYHIKKKQLLLITFHFWPINDMGIEIVCKTRTGKDFPTLISFSNFETDNKAVSTCSYSFLSSYILLLCCYCFFDLRSSPLFLWGTSPSWWNKESEQMMSWN